MIRLEYQAPDTRGLGDDALRIMWERARVNVVKAVLILLNSFKKTVGGTGTGRLYRRGKGGRTHRASAPGHPPARDYGDYVNSFDWAVDETPGEIDGLVGSRMWEKRGKRLEFGTSKMRPRPHVDRAINDARDDIDKVLAS